VNLTYLRALLAVRPLEVLQGVARRDRYRLTNTSSLSFSLEVQVSPILIATRATAPVCRAEDAFSPGKDFPVLPAVAVYLLVRPLCSPCLRSKPARPNT